MTSLDPMLRRVARAGHVAIAAAALLACPNDDGVDDGPAYPIPSTGRLTLAPAALAGRPSVAFHLTLDDHGDGATRTARVVATDRRRLDTRIERVAEGSTTFRLVVETAFLRPGAYLIEVDAEGFRALNLRRYVIEVLEETAAAKGP